VIAHIGFRTAYFEIPTGWGSRVEKELITEAEFMQKLSAERAGYQAMLGEVG